MSGLTSRPGAERDPTNLRVVDLQQPDVAMSGHESERWEVEGKRYAYFATMHHARRTTHLELNVELKSPLALWAWLGDGLAVLVHQ